MIKYPSAKMKEWKPWWDTGWNKYSRCGESEAGITEEEAHSGKKSFYLTITGFWHNPEKDRDEAAQAIVLGNGDGYMQEKAFECKPDTCYYFSFWLKGKGIRSSLCVHAMNWTREGKRNWHLPIEHVDQGKVIPINECIEYTGYVRTAEDTANFVILIETARAGVEKCATIWVDDVYLGLSPRAVDIDVKETGW